MLLCFAVLCVSSYARTSISLSIPLVVGSPVYTQSIPMYESIPVYSPPVRPPMCWNEYYGQWLVCQPHPVSVPIYNQSYMSSPVIIFGYNNQRYQHDNYRYDYHHNYHRGHH